jgi:galactose-1-phosphate uridylyltransferase
MSLEDFSPEILFNALKASLIFIERVHCRDDQVSHASINWNYMPGAGGGLIHPHLQAVVSPRPTHFQDRLIEVSAEYRRTQNRNCWADLVAYEKSEGERYLFQQDEVEFLAAFSPKGMIGEIVAVFTGKTGL